MGAVPQQQSSPERYADLEIWLPTVIDDEVLRTAIERLVYAYNFECSAMFLTTLVFSAITDREMPPGLPSLTALIHIGVDLHDDVTDGDIAGGARAHGQALLAAATCLASLAPQALARLVTGSRLISGLSHFWKGLQVMASGQRVDLALYGDPNPQPRLAQAALRKSADFGIYASLAACVAGSAANDLPRWNELGVEFGCAVQLSSDCTDAIHASGRDIIAGARTLPITLALQAGTEQEREGLLRDLARAPSDADARIRVRQSIEASGSMSACGTLVEVAIARVESHLASLIPANRGRELASFIADCSWFRRRK